MGHSIRIFVLLIPIFLTSNFVLCLPLEFFAGSDNLNNVTYFYYGKVQKVLLESDLNILLNNFNQVSFESIKYKDQNENLFLKNDPKNHYNLILNLKDNYINYYYSFPFSHQKYCNFYKYLYEYDLNGLQYKQYWRPYIGVYDKNYVKVNKLNINPNNYMVSTDLRFKIYNILKMYVNK